MHLELSYFLEVLALMHYYFKRAFALATIANGEKYEHRRAENCSIELVHDALTISKSRMF